MPRTKKRYNRRRRRRKTTESVQRGVASKMQIATLNYVEQNSIDPATGALGSVIFNAGGCYDPRVATGGHQPQGFDQWMAFYEHFVVIGSKITVDFNSGGLQPSDGTGLVGIGLYPDTTALLSTDLYRVLEWRNTKYRPLGTVDSGFSQARVINKYSAKKFLGRSHPLSDPELKGSLTADPTESAYYHIFVAPANNGDNMTSVDLTIKIEYIVAFIEPKPLPSS